MKILVLAGAEQDMVEAVDYYNRQKPGLGRKFSEEVRKTFDLIAAFPEAWPRFSQGSRRCLVDRFPYGVAYQVDEGSVLIAAVMHLKRDPRRWQEALNARLGDGK
jgi:plasmid stabilization system protein ParE